jgi:hypothetical protein
MPVNFLEASLVEEVADSLPGGHLSFGMLVLNARLTPAHICFLDPSHQILDFLILFHEATSR